MNTPMQGNRFVLKRLGVALSPRRLVSGSSARPLGRVHSTSTVWWSSQTQSLFRNSALHRSRTSAACNESNSKRHLNIAASAPQSKHRETMLDTSSIRSARASFSSSSGVIFEEEDTADLDESGHVFVLRADIRQLCCDAVLFPTSNVASRQWFPSGLASGVPCREFYDLRYSEDKHRVAMLQNIDGTSGRAAGGGVDGSDARQVWLAHIDGYDYSKRQCVPIPGPSWFVEAAKQFLYQSAQTLKDNKITPFANRAKHLLAIPIVGSGLGGAATFSGELLRMLLEMTYQFTKDVDVDVAIVAYDGAMYSAAQAARRNILKGERLPTLSKRLSKKAAALASLAQRDDLVFFVGAGCSAPAGMPLWHDLLYELANESVSQGCMTAEEAESLRVLSPLDAAAVLENRVGSQGLHHAVARHMSGRRHCLAHSLIANLGRAHIVTTNYDTLLEEALRGSGQDFDVLPYESSRSGRWVLKLHGSVEHPADTVLTRESFLRYEESRAALFGIVQASMITKHMVFIGFSLEDDNFRRLASTVRKAVQPAPHERRDGRQVQVGTVFTLFDRPFAKELWPGFSWVAMDPSKRERSGEPKHHQSRQLEIFMDEIVLRSSNITAHVLDTRFDSAATPEELAIRAHVLKLADDLSADPIAHKAPAMHLVNRMFHDMGLDLEDDDDDDHHRVEAKTERKKDRRRRHGRKAQEKRMGKTVEYHPRIDFDGKKRRKHLSSFDD